jgi:neutral ceramidase
MDRRAENPNFEYEIQAFRVGDIALLALIGEPFVEGQLDIKLRSPVRHTYIAHMSNGYVGYIPNKHAFKGGGYETWTSAWSKLVPEALEMICDASVELLEDVFKGAEVAKPAKQKVPF